MKNAPYAYIDAKGNDTRTINMPAINDDKDAARQWHEHEHTSEQAAIEAQKLVTITGSVELAKQALDAAGEPVDASSRERFAQQLGYVSFLEMFEASTPSVDANGRPWYVTPHPNGGEWLAWNERDLTTNRSFPTVEAATAWVRSSTTQQAPSADA